MTSLNLSTEDPARAADQWELDINVELLILRSTYGATVDITDRDERTDTVTVSLRAADGHQATRTVNARYVDVLQTLEGFTRDEQLIACGTPKPTRIGQRFRSRKHTCGRAIPRRLMPISVDDVWRCESCKAKKKETTR